MTGSGPDRRWSSIAKVLDVYPINSPWVRGVVARYGLPTWFAVQSILGIANAAADTRLLYFDGRLYLEATRAWLHGSNPWDVSLAGNYFAAPPPTLLPFVPLTWLPADVAVAIIAVAVIGGGLATIRLLRLPWWWLSFPPLVQCFLSANVQSLLIPLVLVGLGPVAVLLKVYAGIPLVLLGRWRSTIVAFVVLLATAPLIPWGQFIEQLPVITERLNDQSKYTLPLIPTALLTLSALSAMAFVGRWDAAWLAVPALWPSPQYYYRTLAMPIRHDGVAALVALPIPGSPVLALVLLAVVGWRRGDRPGWTRLVRRVPGVVGPSVR